MKNLLTRDQALSLLILILVIFMPHIVAWYLTHYRPGSFMNFSGRFVSLAVYVMSVYIAITDRRHVVNGVLSLVKSILSSSGVMDRFLAKKLVEGLSWCKISLEKSWINTFEGDLIDERRANAYKQIRFMLKKARKNQGLHELVQDYADLMLKTLAEEHQKACKKENNLRTMYGEKELSSYKDSKSAKEISDYFQDLKEAAKEVRLTEKKFWRPHFLVDACGYRTWPKFRAYLALKLEAKDVLAK
jgi:hypothetical protein